MKKMILMAIMAAGMMMSNAADAQVRHRADRRPVVGMEESQYAKQLRKINFLKRELQREKIIAKSDGIITFREKRAIQRRKNELDRMMGMHMNMLVRR